MKGRNFEPLYQEEDEFISIRIGKPGENTGAFIAFDATPDRTDRPAIRLYSNPSFNGHNYTAKL